MKTHLRPAGYRWLQIVPAALSVLFAVPAAGAQQTLYSFNPYIFGTVSPGSHPAGPLLRDASGALYGTTSLGGAYFNGAVFKLTPPAPGRTEWTMSVLHSFTGGSDGGSPNPGLVMDAAGAIYGTAQTGGSWMNQGLVFKLTPPGLGSSQWTHTVLHYFYYFRWGYDTNDGSNPGAGLVMDRNGVLYGTTHLGGSTAGASSVGYGTVFKLTPPAPGQTQWTETVLYRFNGGADGETPMSTLTLDSAGNLYGTTLYGGIGECPPGDLRQWAAGEAGGCGTVFKLSPPRPGETTWTKTTIRSFSGQSDGGTPHGKLLLDASGALFGATYRGGTGGCMDTFSNVIGCGVVFKLIPPASGQNTWRQSVIHDFSGNDGAFPQGGLIAGANGALFGTASSGYTNIYGVGGYGLVFKLAPPAAGQVAWTRTVLHNFDVSRSGSLPLGELVRGPDGRLFGVTYLGGVHYGGTVFEITP